MFLSYNKHNVITAISELPFVSVGQEVKQVSLPQISDTYKLIGKIKRIKIKKTSFKDLKVAFMCNWNDTCGISTYSKYLLEAIKPKVAEVKVFSETNIEHPQDEPFVVRCWSRGKSMKTATDLIKEWDPDLLIIQHEFGIFPKAGPFLHMLQELENVPYLLTMHSVYEHLDKSVCTSAIKSIVVHTKEGKEMLHKLGNNNSIFVIPHGCVEKIPEDKEELWNIFQTPYAIVQFGFGFFYKGVDIVLDAIHHLKNTFPEKYQEIFYCYLCSDNPHTSIIHNNYYNFLQDKIKTLGLTDNCVIIRKFQTEQTINHYLRTAKLALFPYRSDPKNVVYGASGAVRIAMANGTPVIVSNSHQFDDLDGVLPRPFTHTELAVEIDKVFSDSKHRQQVIESMERYIEENTWEISAMRYLALYDKVIESDFIAEIN